MNLIIVFWRGNWNYIDFCIKVDIVYSFSLILPFMDMVGDARDRIDEPSGPIAELFCPLWGVGGCPMVGILFYTLGLLLVIL